MKSKVLDLLSLCSKLLLWTSAAGIIAMAGIIGWQVFARYVLNASPAWAEQGSLVLMFWFVSFAAAAGVREGFHIRISAFADALPEPVRKPLRIAVQGVVALLGVAMAVWGGALIVQTWSHDIPTLGLPRGVAYLPLPISGVLITLFALENMLDPAPPHPPAGMVRPEEL